MKMIVMMFKMYMILDNILSDYRLTLICQIIEIIHVSIEEKIKSIEVTPRNQELVGSITKHS